eukprot:g18169.t1
MAIWWLIGVLWTSPYSVRRYFRARKRDRGYQALSTGLIAAGAGNSLLARKMSVRTRGLLSADQEPLIHLLDAQTALIEGRYDEARAKFETMAQDPETRELGLRGLYMEARRLGANEAATQYAEKAAEQAPYLPWASQATLESQSRSGRWDEALRTLDQQRAAQLVDKTQGERLKAVLLTARAAERLEGDPKGARDDASAALKHAKDLVPAAIIAAKAWLREDNLRKAASVLEAAWKLAPHPDLAGAYVRARSGDSTLDRLKRAEKLEAMRPNNIESLMAVAQAALDAQDFSKARAKAEAAARMGGTERVYLLLADVEEAETGDQGRIRYWMGQALRAPRDPAWVADGHVSDHWLPLSPVTGRLDAFEWKAPFNQLDTPTLEGSLAFLSTLTTPHNLQEFSLDDPRVAFVALCFQVMEADGAVSDREQAKFRDLLRERYDLSDDKLKALIKAGHEAGSEAVDYYRFTSDLRRYLVNEDDRVELLGILWEIVYADGQRSEIEDHVIWRIADLLGISSRDRVLQRQQAAARLADGQREES